MMAPTVVLGRDGPRLVVGSAGSVRLRGAIMQVIVNVLAHGLDVAAAIDAVAALAAPLDLARVVTIGHSAGGHLALWAAARSGLPSGAPGAEPGVHVSGAVAQAGVVDLLEAYRLNLISGAAEQLLGGSPERRAERYGLASPSERLPLGVRQLLVHGELDDTVPVAMSRAYRTRARAAGDDVELAVLEGRPERLLVGRPAEGRGHQEVAGVVALVGALVEEQEVRARLAERDLAGAPREPEPSYCRRRGEVHEVDRRPGRVGEDEAA
jgi:acetyl esterase/lipase